MKLNIFYICFAAAFISLMACDTNGPTAAKNSALELGKSHLADGDRLRGINDKMKAKSFYQKAIVEFENAVREDAKVPGLARMLGISQYRVRDFDNAIQWLTQATNQDKSDEVAFQYLGYCQINKSQIQEAEKSFKQAFALNESGVVKTEIIDELMDIGELSIDLGSNFIQQGATPQGTQYKRLGMRIMAMGLEFSEYDMTLAKKVELFAKNTNEQVLIDWIGNIIENDGRTEQVIKIK